MQAVEDAGGMYAAVESGLVQRLIGEGIVVLALLAAASGEDDPAGVELLLRLLIPWQGFPGV